MSWRAALPLLLALSWCVAGRLRGAGGTDRLVGPELDLRWDNVEGVPVWVEGERLLWSTIDQVHGAFLKPGASFTLNVPGATILRLWCPGRALGGSDLRVYSSDGGGLEIGMDPLVTEGESTLLYLQSDQRARYLRVVRPAESAAPLRVVPFLSRAAPMGGTFKYQKLIDLGGSASQLAERGGSSPDAFWSSASSPLEADVVGPAQLMLVTRLKLEDEPGEPVQQYTIRVNIDKELKSFAAATGADLRSEWYLDGRPVVLGGVRRFRLDVPAGLHRIRLHAPSRALVRLLARSESDFLLHRETRPESVPPTAYVQGLEALQDALTTSARLRGGMLLRQAASTLSLTPEERSNAWGFLRRLTRYRTLLPRTKNVSTELTPSWFILPELLDPGEERGTVQMSPDLLDEVAMGLPQGVFLQAPAGRQNAHVLEIPPRSSATLLRIIVSTDASPRDRPVSGEWYVQIDDRPATLLRLGGPRAGGECLRPSNSVAAREKLLHALVEEAGDPGRDHEPLREALEALLPAPVPLVKGSAVEIELPVEASQVQVWARDVGSPPLAFQWLGGSSLEGATELDWLELAEALGPERGVPWLLETYRRWDRKERQDDLPSVDYTRAAEALFRYLKMESERFQNSVFPPEDTASVELDPADLAGEGEHAARATSWESAGEWLLALEEWSEELAAPNPETRLDARLGRVRCLLALGEQFLADRQLRGCFLFERDPCLRRLAFTELSALYRRAEAWDQLVGATWRALQEFPEPTLLEQLCEALVKDGRSGLGLMAGLALRTESQEHLVRASWDLRWWRVFETLVEGLSSDSLRRRWLGARLVRQGHFSPGLEQLRASGPEGDELALGVEWARSIRALVASPRPTDRERAVEAWARWQSQQPGQGTFEEDSTAVVDAAGGVAGYVRATDLHSLYYRADPDRPLIARLVGPGRVKVDARPLHPAGKSTAESGWLYVAGQDWIQPFPWSWNLPPAGLETISSDGTRLGATVSGEVLLPPGPQEVRVWAPGASLAVKVLVAIPELALDTLPRLTAGRVRQLVGQQALAAHLNQSQLGLQEALNPARLAAEMRRVAPADDSGLRNYMATLLQATEVDACLLPEAQALGEAAFRARPDVPGIGRLYSRLVSGTEWQRVGAVRASAGIRRLPVHGWQPENQDLRLRSRFLERLGPTDRYVSAGTSVALDFEGATPRTLRLELTPRTLEFLPRVPLVVVCQIDGELHAKVELAGPGLTGDSVSSDDSAEIQVPIAAGRHQVRLYLEQAVLNHFVQVRVLEGGSVGSSLPGEVGEPEDTRTYHVATPDNPLRLAVSGPTLLQIDELEDGVTRSRRQLVGTGWNEIVLAPEGKLEGLYRVFQRVQSGGGAAVLPAELPEEEEGGQVDASPQPVDSSRDGRILKVRDVHYLGGQEDGTVSSELSLVRRRLLDELGTDRAGARHFLQLALAHRYFWERLGTFFETRALARLEEYGGPLVGVQEEVRFRPEWLPFTVGAAASFHLQWPNGDLAAPRGRSEWAAAGKVSVSRSWALHPRLYHQPSVTLFGRLLSLGDLDQYDRRDVDQDIFTSYRRQHRHGWSLAERVVYTPWLDSEVWGRVVLVTNEDWNPGRLDQFSATTGWNQFVGGLEVDLYYQYTRFFHDSDRLETRNRHSLFLDLKHDLWCTPRDRLESSLSFRYDVVDGVMAGMLQLVWHFSGGRNYRDFPPGEINFLELRRAMIPREGNNRIEEIPR